MASPITPTQTNLMTITITSADSNNFTPGGRAYLITTVQEYGQMVISESKNIEQLEHTGLGPLEITAGHVEEAKWVLIRRQRRRLRHSNWITAMRIGQAFMSLAIGIGASNFAQLWGSVLCVVSVLVVATLFVVEREISREL